MIAFDALTKTIGDKPIVGPVTLDIQQGEVLALFGPNGCGKSTLMNIITGITQPSTGSIQFSEPVTQRCGYVFQDYRRHLLPYKTARQNILFPLQLRKMLFGEQQKRLDKITALVGVDFDLDQPIHTLSGGQAQRVSVMRALIIDPVLLILDEPFSALDYQATLDLQTVLLRVMESLHLTTILISHNVEEAVLMADRLVVMTKRPGTVHRVLPIDLPRPRSHDLLGTPEFARLHVDAIKAFREII